MIELRNSSIAKHAYDLKTIILHLKTFLFKEKRHNYKIKLAV